MFGRIAFLSGETLQASLSRSFCSLFCLSGPSLSVFVPLGIPRASQEIATTVAMRLSTRHSAELLSCDSDFDSGCDVLWPTEKVWQSQGSMQGSMVSSYFLCENILCFHRWRICASLVRWKPSIWMRRLCWIDRKWSQFRLDESSFSIMPWNQRCNREIWRDLASKYCHGFSFMVSSGL